MNLCFPSSSKYLNTLEDVSITCMCELVLFQLYIWFNCTSDPFCNSRALHGLWTQGSDTDSVQRPYLTDEGTRSHAHELLKVAQDSKGRGEPRSATVGPTNTIPQIAQSIRCVAQRQKWIILLMLNAVMYQSTLQKVLSDWTSWHFGILGLILLLKVRNHFPVISWSKQYAEFRVRKWLFLLVK